MAQIYPEDRGTNYAMRNGDQIAKNVMLASTPCWAHLNARAAKLADSKR